MKTAQPLTPREKLLDYARKCIDATRGWEGELIDASEVSRKFGISASTLEALLQARQVICLPAPVGQHKFPAEQFVAGGVVPALDQLIEIIDNQAECWRWLVQSRIGQDGDRLINSLKQGRAAEVLALAHRQYDPL